MLGTSGVHTIGTHFMAKRQEYAIKLTRQELILLMDLLADFYTEYQDVRDLLRHITFQVSDPKQIKN